MAVGSSDTQLHLVGKSTRPMYGKNTYEIGKELALLSDVPSVQQSTGTSTTATMSQNAITSALSSKADTSAIPTKTSQLTNDSNFMNTSNATISKNLTGTTTITINGVSLSLSVSNGTLTIS